MRYEGSASLPGSAWRLRRRAESLFRVAQRATAKRESVGQWRDYDVRKQHHELFKKAHTSRAWELWFGSAEKAG